VAFLREPGTAMSHVANRSSLVGVMSIDAARLTGDLQENEILAPW
jgi:hypothetical protein